MKKWLIYIFIILFITLSAFAYSKDKGLEWLNNNVNWADGQIEENSFSLLALKHNNYNTDTGYEMMLHRMDPSSCFPAGNCNVKDTALTALAFKSLNKDIKPLLTWLDSSLTTASVHNWYIQIKSEKSEECTLTYGQGQTKKVFVNGTEKLKIDNRLVDWIDIERNLFTLTKPIENVKVDCTKLDDSGIVISLLRIQGNDYYIIQEIQSSIANLVINNACYPINPGNSCDEESSFYAAFALKKLNEEVKVLPYLLDKVNNNLRNSMIFILTNDQKYLENLISNQNPSGYWDNEDIYVTSFAINALKNSRYRDELNNATTWLKSKQITELSNEGSFGNIRNTAVALYLALTDISYPPPGDGGENVCGDSVIETGEECDDGNLINDDGCSSICKNETIEEECITDLDCPLGKKCESQVCVISGCQTDSDCPNPTKEYCDTYTNRCVKIETEECASDSDCPGSKICNQITNKCEEKEITEECNSNSDCASSQICDSNTKKCESKPETTEDEGNGLGSLFWISLIIIILILGGGGYFAYTKFFKKIDSENKPRYFMEEEPKKPIKTSYQPRQMVSRRNNIDESLEKELDKSIKEAEKLLRK